jgi:tRNA threonylcarbamoyladenosine biosynthesis protein TsaB
LIYLALDTSTHLCSVAVFSDERLLALKESHNDTYTHAENLHLYIAEAVRMAGIAMNMIEVVAVGKGPGSYTGLRIGISAAKGICYALGIPLVSVNSLEIMALNALTQGGRYSSWLALTDARRMEVYCAAFDSEMKALDTVSAKIVTDTSFRHLPTPVAYFGDGATKCLPILQEPDFHFIPGILPSAAFLGEPARQKIARGDLENTAYFEPFYLKEFLAGKPGGSMPQ